MLLALYVAVSCDQCTDPVTAGSLSYGNTISEDKTYILAGYEIPANATVVAWEFCYQKTDAASAIFYPGILRIIPRKKDETDYDLIQSNVVTYDPSVKTDQPPCLMFNLSVTDHFTVSEESVVGLYSNHGAFLLRTDTDDAIITYEAEGNQSTIYIKENINFNISIRVHLGKQSVIHTDLLNDIATGTSRVD